jgi:hypothetical protein
VRLWWLVELMWPDKVELIPHQRKGNYDAVCARDSLHRLIDELPESELAAAERFLNYIRATADPVLKALLEAPLDDEPETEGERQLVHEVREELARGEVRTLEEVRRELGL